MLVPNMVLFLLQAYEKSKYEQSLESVKHFIAIAEKELELYYRHVSLYGDPSNRNPLSILDEESCDHDRDRLYMSCSDTEADSEDQDKSEEELNELDNDSASGRVV